LKRCGFNEGIGVSKPHLSLQILRELCPRNLAITDVINTSNRIELAHTMTAKKIGASPLHGKNPIEVTTK
jgi:hypothetical protein